MYMLKKKEVLHLFLYFQTALVEYVWFLLYFFKDLFIYDRHREREAETQEEGEAGSMPGVRCGTRGSRPGRKAGAKPLSHPGIPSNKNL